MAVAVAAGARIAALAAGGAGKGVHGEVRSARFLGARSQWRSAARAGDSRIVVVAGAAARRSSFRVRAAGDGVEVEVEAKNNADVLPSGEWPENFSLLNFEDLLKHYEPVLFKEEAQPGSFLADVMSKTIYTAYPEQKLSEVAHFFNQISGLPVVNSNLECVGVLSRKDRSKAKDGQDSSLVKDVMSTPAITLSADKTVSDAAVLMLKNKIHRIPIVNSTNQVVGIVTRTDIFNALEGGPLDGK
ncbi:hypothetical protein MPTK1_1g08300 [Marchantia polymorpha subsp. ruderalis]|uniref:CBS domain-containing protein n=2 Tax=Marchantia polymorpha TaxID=3197 RepID=A0AAF6AMW5_MARPO|nr:hypothetical protein MARPO_0036s0073 [Marchantia polymorpha]BBM97785.1 hypothetical protein Mp_1g08300 [Marchantia polymorpha subsp. ruderalis]|eukprot:PTQ41088.1 hypothetical protein MARPO_0036s0073 [Marchantia polymorpha]